MRRVQIQAAPSTHLAASISSNILVSVKVHRHESSPRAPFSAVTPAPIRPVLRVPVQIKLETIYEEEENEEESVETSQNLSAQSSCFYQLPKPPPSPIINGLSCA